VSTTPPESPDPVFDLICHLVSSARGAPEEGVYTASLRLIHAAGRLAEVSDGGDGPRGEFMRELATRIRAESTPTYLHSPEDYLAFLDGVLRSVATEVRRRDGLPVATNGQAGDPARR
jgi:hypothetical protein